MKYLYTLSIESLLLLRVAFDDKNDVCDLHQDVMDLYLFPERLDESYTDEWRAYVRRALAKASINEALLMQIMAGEHAQDSDTSMYLKAKLTEAKPTYLSLLAVLQKVQQQQSSQNVHSLSTPLHKWLEWAIS